MKDKVQGSGFRVQGGGIAANTYEAMPESGI
jgi:hypothetical protein